MFLFHFAKDKLFITASVNKENENLSNANNDAKEEKKKKLKENIPRQKKNISGKRPANNLCAASS